VPRGLLADGPLWLLLLGLGLSIPKRPFGDEAWDVVLLEEPNLGKPVVLGDVSFDTSLFEIVPKKLPVELAFEV